MRVLITSTTTQLFRRWLFLILIFSGCSAPRTTVDTPLKNHPFKSFTIKSVKLSNTFADTSAVSKRLQELETITTKLLTNKGFRLAQNETADGAVIISIQTDLIDATSSDELRMMKGMHGSKFPSQNPRVRNLESDFLIFNISSSEGGRTLYSARCQLVKGQDQFSEPGSITFRLLDECLREVIAPL